MGGPWAGGQQGDSQALPGSTARRESPQCAGRGPGVPRASGPSDLPGGQGQRTPEEAPTTAGSLGRLDSGARGASGAQRQDARLGRSQGQSVRRTAARSSGACTPCHPTEWWLPTPPGEQRKLPLHSLAGVSASVRALAPRMLPRGTGPRTPSSQTGSQACLPMDTRTPDPGLRSESGSSGSTAPWASPT